MLSFKGLKKTFITHQEMKTREATINIHVQDRIHAIRYSKLPQRPLPRAPYDYQGKGKQSLLVTPTFPHALTNLRTIHHTGITEGNHRTLLKDFAGNPKIMYSQL